MRAREREKRNMELLLARQQGATCCQLAADYDLSTRQVLRILAAAVDAEYDHWIADPTGEPPASRYDLLDRAVAKFAPHPAGLE